MHENRETSEMPEANFRDRPAGEGNSRTTRAHVLEESDSGRVPMNHSNNGGKPPAESEEGRPLIKENTHQSSTHSTQSGEAATKPAGPAESPAQKSLWRAKNLMVSSTDEIFALLVPRKVVV